MNFEQKMIIFQMDNIFVFLYFPFNMYQVQQKKIYFNENLLKMIYFQITIKICFKT